MVAFDSDYSRAQKEGDIVLERDDPEKRECALKFLIRQGQEDLVEMVGLLKPIGYGAKA